MTSLVKFYNFPLNLYDAIDDVTDCLKKSEIETVQTTIMSLK